MRAFPSIIALSLLSLLALPSGQAAGATYQFKIATIAPQGSVWANHFDQFKKSVQEKSAGQLDFQIYYGGVMGDDRAMARKMRIGLLQGAGMTVTGLSEIVPDFRVMSLSFLFENYGQVDAAWNAVLPMLTQQFAAKNLVLLANTEVGFVYTMSTKPIGSPEELKKAKCWIPDGDPLSLAFLQRMGISPVPMSVADVLPSLQTGLIDTVFNSYYGSLVLQWFTVTKHMGDIPFGYAYGALVLDRRAFERLPEELRRLVKEEAAVSLGESLRQDTRKSNAEALVTLKENGIEIDRTDADSRAAYLRLRVQVVEESRGTLFSDEIYRRIQQTLGSGK